MYNLRTILKQKSRIISGTNDKSSYDFAVRKHLSDKSNDSKKKILFMLKII